MIHPSLFRDAIPHGALSSPEAFARASERLHMARRAIDATLIAGEFLRLQHAFRQFPHGSQATWEIQGSQLHMRSLFIAAPAGALVPGEEALLAFHHGKHPQGSTDSTPNAFLDGPGADFTAQAWIRPALDACLLAAPMIQPALTAIHAIASATPERAFKSQRIHFRAQDASLAMFAELFGFEEQIAYAEAIILADDTGEERFARMATRSL